MYGIKNFFLAFLFIFAMNCQASEPHASHTDKQDVRSDRGSVPRSSGKKAKTSIDKSKAHSRAKKHGSHVQRKDKKSMSQSQRQDRKDKFKKKHSTPERLKKRANVKLEKNQRSPGKNTRELRKANKKPATNRRKMTNTKRSVKSNQKKYNAGNVQKRPVKKQSRPYR